MAKSKKYNIGGNKFVSFNFNSDGKIEGILDHSTRPPKAIDPNSQQFADAIAHNGGGTALSAQNINNYGGEKDAYTRTISVASPSELDQFYGVESKSESNRENNIEETIYPNIDDGIANPNLATQSPTFAAYGSTRTMQSGSEFFTYPLDIDPTQDHLKISKFKYKRNDALDGTGSVVQGSRPPGLDEIELGTTQGEKFLNIFRTNRQNKIKPITLERVREEGDSMLGNQLLGSVMLPMPKVVDTNGCEWGESELNIFGLAAVAAAEQGQQLIGKSFFGGTGRSDKLDVAGVKKDELRDVEQITARAQRGGAFFKNLKNAGALGMAAMAEGTARITGQSVSQDQFLARTSGRVLNPNAELLFQGPVLRDFNFDFLMIARSEREGREIRKIIRWFKSGMAPKFNSATFLKTPDIFTLEYKNGVGDEDILKTVNRFSPGGLALRTIAVDYSPSGYWAAYQDSQPVAIKMSLNFAELRPIYAQDQNQDKMVDTVGY